MRGCRAGCRISLDGSSRSARANQLRVRASQLRFHGYAVVSRVNGEARMMLANISKLTMPESEWEDYACPDDCAEFPDDPDNWTDESEED